MKQIPIVPICHSGLEPSALPVPFVLLQGLHASNREGLNRLSHAVAKTIGSRAPKGDADRLIAEVKAFEAGYTPTLQTQLGPVTTRAEAARKRVYAALKDSSFKWRTVSKLAVVGGLTEDEVVELLLTDENVQFGRGEKSHERIARLRNREA